MTYFCHSQVNGMAQEEILTARLHKHEGVEANALFLSSFPPNLPSPIELGESHNIKQKKRALLYFVGLKWSHLLNRSIMLLSEKITAKNI